MKDKEQTDTLYTLSNAKVSHEIELELHDNRIYVLEARIRILEAMMHQHDLHNNVVTTKETNNE